MILDKSKQKDIQLRGSVPIAEICLDCYNKKFPDREITAKNVIMDDDICEFCGEYKTCIVQFKHKNPIMELIHRFKIKINK